LVEIETQAKVKAQTTIMEIAKNFEDPLELIREALSNSWDAHSKNVTIKLYFEPPEGDQRVLVIETVDDGDGMDRDGIARFSALGDSLKTPGTIGSKGFGTKIYYRSQKVEVVTVSKRADGKRKKIVIVCDQPWKTLQRGDLPIFKGTEEDTNDQTGTTIRIWGFDIDLDQQKRFYHSSLKDYVLWRTIGGSTERSFNPSANILMTTLDTSQFDPNGKIESFWGDHRLPEENLSPTPSTDPNEIYKETTGWCKRFGPTTLNCGRTSTNVDVRAHVIGAVAGDSARDTIFDSEIRQHIRPIERFGVYFARNYFIIERINEVLPYNELPNNFHFIADCEQLELTANRNSVRDKEAETCQLFIRELKRYMEEIVYSACQEEFFKKREEERELYERLKIAEKMDQTLYKYERRRILNAPLDEVHILKEPTNEFETALLLQSMINSGHYPEIDFRIGAYNPRGTDLIVEILPTTGSPPTGPAVVKKWVEVEYAFKKFLGHGHLPREVHGIVVWDMDVDSEAPEEERRWKLMGETWTYSFESETRQHRLIGGIPSRLVNIYVLSEILERHRQTPST